jgi:hypothetical protein
MVARKTLNKDNFKSFTIFILANSYGIFFVDEILIFLQITDIYYVFSS